MFRFASFAQLYACIIKGVPLIFSKGFLGNLEDPNLAGIIIMVSEKFNLITPQLTLMISYILKKLNNKVFKLLYLMKAFLACK